MSGGSMDYLCFKVEDQVVKLKESRSPLRRAFAEHLVLVSKALHDIEWVDDGDYSSPTDEISIKAVFENAGNDQIIKHMMLEAKELIKELNSFSEESGTTHLDFLDKSSFPDE